MERGAGPFTGVVVARIVSAERHPQADKLQGVPGRAQRRCGCAAPSALQIVCGAPMRAPDWSRAGRASGGAAGRCAPSAPRQLRGVESRGMLCSARELGLAEIRAASSSCRRTRRWGPICAPSCARRCDSGSQRTPIAATRMSVLGIAREVAALSGAPLKTPALGREPSAPAAASAARCRSIAVTLQPGADAARLLARCAAASTTPR